MIFIRQYTMLFMYVSGIFGRAQFYITTPASLNALLYLMRHSENNLGEQMARTL